MKILLLVNDPLTLIARLELIDALLLDGHAVVIASPPDGLVDGLREKGCQHEALTMNRRGTNPLAEAGLFLRIFKLIRRLKPDVVLSFTVKPNIYGGISCRWLRRPIIANITGLGTAVEDGGLLSRLILRLYRTALRQASCVFFQNQANMALLRPVLGSQVHQRLIPGSGVSLIKHSPQPYPGDEEGLRLLFVGRVMKNKGMDELIDAVGMLRKTASIELDVLGICEDDYVLQLELAREQGLLRYHGFQADVRPWLAACHCLVLPSYHEGMANVLLEAAACARPVIASRIPGCQEAFDEGQSGLGCEPRSLDSLLDALERFLLMHHEDRRDMGLAGRRKVEASFDRGIIIKAYREEIASAAKEKKR